MYLLIQSFNPRSRKGNDDDQEFAYADISLFQSTFPQGERRLIRGMLPSYSSFNPRSRKGNDAYDGGQSKKDMIVSIHVPARGTTAIFTSLGNNYDVSIHVPARGTTGYRRSYQQ